MLAAVATISLGTLYPIVLDALNIEKISVGEPYFNTVFLPMVLPLLLLMGFAPHVSWGKQTAQTLWHKLRLNLLLCLFLSVALPWACGFSIKWLASTGIFFGLWVVMATLQYLYQVWIARGRFDLHHAAMIVAHLGIAVIALGITFNKSYSEEKQVKIQPGETVELAGYTYHFDKIAEEQGPNYKSATATFSVTKSSHAPQILIAQQRIYTSHDQALSKPGILANPWRDLYLALGSPLPGEAWSVRIYYKPLVRWIWFGGFMLLVGGLLSLLYSIKKRGRV
jgi:cytochrome c-type biogenesis protein CcmF